MYRNGIQMGGICATMSEPVDSRNSEADLSQSHQVDIALWKERIEQYASTLQELQHELEDVQ